MDVNLLEFFKMIFRKLLQDSILANIDHSGVCGQFEQQALTANLKAFSLSEMSFNRQI